jgi:hypothetical protein
MAKKNENKDTAAPVVDEATQQAGVTPAQEDATPEKTDTAAPVFAAGDHFKTVKVRFKTTVCAEYGTFYKGEIGTIALYIANELEKCGAGVIVKE